MSSQQYWPQWSVTAVEKTKEAVEKYCSSLTVQVVAPPVLVKVNEDAVQTILGFFFFMETEVQKGRG